jgi:UDPglucose--hexose-1-phosphate uridylyltransferase
MAELRKDPVLGRWVIIATERVRRPTDFRAPSVPAPPGPCALCAGHEHETPPEILAYRDPADAPANGSGWRVRVVPNKFPALRIEHDLERRGHGLYDLMTGVGAHEVVVESPAHGLRLGDLPLDAVEDVLRAYRDRMLDLQRDPRFRSIVIFKRHGTRRGPYAGHPTSEILAAPILPFVLGEELHQARTYHDFRERCLFCDILQQEDEEQTRVVAAGPHVLAFAPFAARVAFETWVLPRRHGAAFEAASPEELQDLARVLRAVLRKLDRSLADPPFQLLVHSAPVGERDSPSYHWHIEILPQLGWAARVEAVSGLPSNPMPPEDAARFLRDTPD